MKLKLLHLNIEEGKQQEKIVNYVREEDFDILLFQEVTGGEHNPRGNENFSELKEVLGYEGIQAIYWNLQDDPKTYMSNATFFKPSFRPVSHHIELLKKGASIAIPRAEMRDYSDHPTVALDVVFELQGKRIHFINTHLVWGPKPNDEPYKVEQGKVLYEYLKRLHDPFVLSGDFNVTADSQIVRWIDELGVNHTVAHRITNTLNPNLHRAKQLFPKGLAVDFLYTEKSLKVEDFSLVNTPDLSDHFGLRITLEV